ncbi:MAG: metallophosphoesterase, partial [Deltaproteobacteria bacterium]|nr:metallophosphoesterase [Deltaproteobacteria bacterium]
MGFCLVLGGAASIAGADSSDRGSFGPVDLAYARRPVSQKTAIVSHVDRLVWPTLISPALVRSGGRLRVIVRLTKGPDGKDILPKKVLEGDGHGAEGTAWGLYLLPAPGRPPARCPVMSWRRVGRGYLRIEARVPVSLARDVYELRLVAPGIDESQPNAVRVYGGREANRFRFVVMTDHQLWDPSYALFGRALNSGAYPKRPKTRQLNASITRQGFDEVSLLDPAFVLYTGDLIFGLDFTAEYRQAREELRRSRLPIFAVPGNHDGYAVYTVRLKGSALHWVTKTLVCQKHLRGELSWERLWAFIGCFYGDVKSMLYADLQQDGLAFWRRQLGPTEYAFDYGRFRFIAVNTYAGTPERRHAFSIYMDALDLHLGAPAVDNYGGYLTDAQLARIEHELATARRRGLTPIVFGH